MLLLLLVLLGVGCIAFCRDVGVRLKRRARRGRFERTAAATRVRPFHLAATLIGDVLLASGAMNLRAASCRDPLEAHPATASRHDINVHG
jgi:hypothetical protein